MAVYFETSESDDLLDRFDARIAQTEENGKITTWEKSANGKHYTHKAAEWRKKAWFKAATKSDGLVFNIIKPQNQNISTTVYGYYHGDLIETFLNHFDKRFEEAQATGMPADGDICSS
jgi:hypothetical protein